MGRAAGRSDHLFRHLTLCIIVILDGIDDHLGGYNLIGNSDIGFSRANNSAVLVLVIIFLFTQDVNRPYNISLAVIHIFVMRNVGSCRILPLFVDHLTDAVILGEHFVPVCIGQLFESAVPCLVRITNQGVGFAVDADGFQVVECIVVKDVFQTVATDNLGHVVKGVVSVRDVGKFCSCGIFTGNFGCLA